MSPILIASLLACVSAFVHVENRSGSLPQIASENLVETIREELNFPFHAQPPFIDAENAVHRAILSLQAVPSQMAEVLATSAPEALHVSNSADDEWTEKVMDEYQKVSQEAFGKRCGYHKVKTDDDNKIIHINGVVMSVAPLVHPDVSEETFASHNQRVVFHYTDDVAFGGMMSTGQVIGSLNDRAHLGSGIYAAPFSPALFETGDEVRWWLTRNNFKHGADVDVKDLIATILRSKKGSRDYKDAFDTLEASKIAGGQWRDKLNYCIPMVVDKRSTYLIQAERGEKSPEPWMGGEGGFSAMIEAESQPDVNAWISGKRTGTLKGAKNFIDAFKEMTMPFKQRHVVVMPVLQDASQAPIEPTVVKDAKGKDKNICPDKEDDTGRVLFGNQCRKPMAPWYGQPAPWDDGEVKDNMLWLGFQLLRAS